MDGCIVNRYAQIHRAILDKYVIVPERARIGLDREHDLARGFTVTPSGITVVPKNATVTD
jgi:glucose-1-phosphate adenylyltransferase